MQPSSLMATNTARRALQRAASSGQLRRSNRGALALNLRRKSSLAAPASAHAMTASAAEPEQMLEEQTLTHASDGRRLTVADWAKRAQFIKPRASLEGNLPKVNSVSLGLENDAMAASEALQDVNPAELAGASRMHITDEDADKWLADFRIPEEQLAKCNSPEEVKELRRRYARQLRLECSVYEMAMAKVDATRQTMNDLGRGSTINSAKDLLKKWSTPARDYIRNEQNKIKNGKHSTDSNIYGPALLLLDDKKLTAIGMNALLNTCLAEAKGPKFIKLALTMGKAVQEEIIAEKEAAIRHSKTRSTDNMFTSLTKSITNMTLKKKMSTYFHDVGGWDKRIQLKVGAALIDCLQRSCFVPNAKTGAVSTPELCAAMGQDIPEPAFLHEYVFERNRRAGVIRLHPAVMNLVLKTNPKANVLPWTARYLPMLVPPTKWTGVVNGGYLKLHTKIMRQRDSAWQMDCLQSGDMDKLYKSLNLLAEVPWVINKEVLDVILKVWEQGGGFGDLPSRTDLPLPERTEEFENDPELYDKMTRKIQQRNQELHSLRCDTLYKLQVAEEFKDEKEIYYPYNMDFRGRVYPIPPNLNHLGSDLSRSLLIFRDRKPLGENGLRWMKIHLANVFGVDKCSFDDRVAFADAHLDQVVASARDPFGEGDCAWWKDADYPFLALGVCFEMKRAIESPDPTKYESNIPIHQDGSCNGLQHYAALGRDLTGGSQVNLVPSPKPSDVYMGVATQVMAKVERDAAMEIPRSAAEIRSLLKRVPPLPEAYQEDVKILDEDSPEEKERKREILKKKEAHMALEMEQEALRAEYDVAQRKASAEFVLGNITRKVVKQTVMTSVYGVTYIGARKQISARLEEIFLTKGHIMSEELENDIYHASCYCAEATMESMGDLFNSARSIMAWLADCASKVAGNGQGMSWITPLGLPVVQPYRLTKPTQVRTKVQHVLMVMNEQLPVSTGRQKSAFPPNFVHSLDSTHMLLTAQRCLEEEKIAFAAVHDSYWTHACSVDIMNRRLREEFVELYEQPLLEELLSELRVRFPLVEFADVPKLGDLDLKSVLESPYFFN